MIPWSRLERRWCEALLAAVVPAAPGFPGLGALPLDGFWAALDGAAAPLLVLGLRAATWLLVLLGPLLWLGRPRLFTALGDADRDELLLRVAASRSYLVRQMATTLKAIACFAYLREPSVRAAVEAAP